MCVRHVPAHAQAQCCFKSFTLRSCQCDRKTRYGLEFWSLDLACTQVFGRVPALSVVLINLNFQFNLVQFDSPLILRLTGRNFGIASLDSHFKNPG